MHQLIDYVGSLINLHEFVKSMSNTISFKIELFKFLLSKNNN